MGDPEQAARPRKLIILKKKLAPALGEGRVWVTQKQEVSVCLCHAINPIVNSKAWNPIPMQEL